MEFFYKCENSLADYLISEGLDVPKGSVDLQFTASIDGIVQLKTTQNLSGDDLLALGRALSRYAESAGKAN